MGSFSGIGICLSLVFGFVLFGLVAELYYLLWWKKKRTSSTNRRNTNQDDFQKINGKEIFYLSCWKKPPNSDNHIKDQEIVTNSVTNPDGYGQEQDIELGLGSDLVLKGFGEESVEAEIMRLHNLCGPPRFLFTIKEESREDLESEDGKSKKGSRTRSLSDLILAIETTTPLSSPNSRIDPCGYGFNPLFESSTDSEIMRLRSSPPPKFKFLRDAEEKMMRRLIEEAQKREAIKGTVKSAEDKEEDDNDDGSEFRFVVGKKRENASQVLPLVSSPLAPPTN